MRAVINISLPTQMAKVIDSEVSTGKFASRSEFFRSLLRAWMEEKFLFELGKSRQEIKKEKGKLLASLKDLR